MSMRKKGEDDGALKIPSGASLEQKLGAALAGFADLSGKLKKEQDSRRRVIVVGSVIFLLMAVLFTIDWFEDRSESKDFREAISALESANATIEGLQFEMCGLLVENRTFAIDSVIGLREALIAALTPDNIDTPEEQADFEEQVAAFREDSQARIDALSSISCRTEPEAGDG